MFQALIYLQFFNEHFPLQYLFKIILKLTIFLFSKSFKTEFAEREKKRVMTRPAKFVCPDNQSHIVNTFADPEIFLKLLKYGR